jgi:hypothetical protein
MSDETERTYVTMTDKSIGKCASGHWLPLNGDCDLCGAGATDECQYTPEIANAALDKEAEK